MWENTYIFAYLNHSDNGRLPVTEMHHAFKSVDKVLTQNMVTKYDIDFSGHVTFDLFWRMVMDNGSASPGSLIDLSEQN